MKSPSNATLVTMQPDKRKFRNTMLTHNGKKSHTCYLCDYTSNYECNVKKHMEIKHTTQKLARRDIRYMSISNL